MELKYLYANQAQRPEELECVSASLSTVFGLGGILEYLNGSHCKKNMAGGPWQDKAKVLELIATKLEVKK